MSSVTIILILFIYQTDRTINSNQCDFLSAIELQSATYSHSLILRVQPVNPSEDIGENLLSRTFLVREVIKIPHSQMKINDQIIIRIDKDLDEILDDSCWYLLRIANVDSILFLNQTSTGEFSLYYPPVESTLRIRENIDAVINYDTYSPQVIIKTRLDKAITANNYSVQCNTRGNPLPRLIWSKNNRTIESYLSTKQCETSCRIYSIQNKYQSILYFQSLTHSDSGVYLCHAENAIDQTMTSVYIDVNQADVNTTCATLEFCHHRGQCIDTDNQLKCLCDNQYFGEQCERNYDDIITKQNDTILLFKSRFLAGCILFLIGFIIVLIVFVTWILTRNNQTPTSIAMTNGKIERIATKDCATATEDNQYQRFNVEAKNNHLISSESYLEFRQSNTQSRLIRPLILRTNIPKPCTRDVSFQNRFRAPES